jgi:quinol monooxygenase YgiN
MAAPFVFVTTHAINEGKLADYLQQHEAFVDFVHAREPRLLEFEAVMNEGRTEVTFVFVFADADAADVHLQLAHEQISRGLEITRTARIDVYGTPGPVLQQVLQAIAASGVPVSIKAESQGGFSRAAAA